MEYKAGRLPALQVMLETGSYFERRSTILHYTTTS